MSEVLYGIVHGKTIELEQDPGLEEGRRVQVVLRQPKPLPGPPPGWYPGCTETAAGMLAGIPGLDEDLEEILAERKRDTRPRAG